MQKLSLDLAALTYSKRHPEDVDAEAGETYACEALRYGLSYKPWTSSRVPVKF